ncbi:MAG: MBOAT family protein [Lachnospiraceae bacterium]|nr:MBOAT family protein [Lachnospiraceae bacterium]
MLFNSVSFFVFFPVVLAVYFLVPKFLKQIWLLIASYYFYMSWNAKYAALILISTVVTYGSGILLGRKENTERQRKTVVAGCLLINLGILFFFKYFNFAVTVIAGTLEKMHLQVALPQIDVLLPVGISFYTFQALSYTMDVYRNDVAPETDFVRYALFVSFFPQLVAGPIERSKNLLWQLKEPKRFDFEKAREGLLLMIWGYFLKVVIADRIAVFVDTVYGSVSAYRGFLIVFATVLFAFQIYCDFYGYSAIATGAARFLGIELMENFDAPYLSASPSVFWRRWHISLTSWFRDYLYVPLGGSRKAQPRSYVNKMIVFLVSGLWHGASFAYVVWGGLNGLYQIIEEMTAPARERIARVLHVNRSSYGYRFLAGVVTFLLVDFSWIFFRAGNLRTAAGAVYYMITEYNPWVLFDGSLYKCGLDEKNFRLLMISLPVLLFADICKRRGIRVRDRICAQDVWCRWIVIAVSIVAILVFGAWGTQYQANSFIYFQF